jgi:hypothetical protein
MSLPAIGGAVGDIGATALKLGSTAPLADDNAFRAMNPVTGEYDTLNTPPIRNAPDLTLRYTPPPAETPGPPPSLLQRLQRAQANLSPGAAWASHAADAAMDAAEEHRPAAPSMAGAGGQPMLSMADIIGLAGADPKTVAAIKQRYGISP